METQQETSGRRVQHEQIFWMRLRSVGHLSAKLRSVPQGVYDALLQWPEDYPDLVDTGGSKLSEFIHEHRLVGDRKHVLVPSVRQRTESRSMPPAKSRPFKETTSLYPKAALVFVINGLICD
jgi:hypothetical protein